MTWLLSICLGISMTWSTCGYLKKVEFETKDECFEARDFAVENASKVEVNSIICEPIKSSGKPTSQ